MPIQVDVFSPLPESWRLCQSCEAFMARAQIEQLPDLGGLGEYPREWQDDFRRLSDLVMELAQRYGDSINIRLYDPRSLPGLLKAIRHKVHRYPTFIISQRDKVTGWNLPAIEKCLYRAGARIMGEVESEIPNEG
jgi:hypothetical protein